MYTQIYFKKVFYNIFLINLYICRIVGDNIDLMIHARIQSAEYTNRSLHWTQQYAVTNRVVEPHLSEVTQRKPIADIEMSELLPGADVQDLIVTHWAVLTSRVITKYLKAFKPFRDVIIYHIRHKYSKEMTEKSESVRSYVHCTYD